MIRFDELGGVTGAIQESYFFAAIFFFLISSETPFLLVLSPLLMTGLGLKGLPPCPIKHGPLFLTKVHSWVASFKRPTECARSGDGAP